MTPEDAKFVLEHIARLDREDQQLTAEIGTLELRRVKVRHARSSLYALVNDEPVRFEGTLANAVRLVLMRENKSHTPTEVRDAVRVLGYDLSKHDNEMAAIHGVLKSLESQDEVKTKEARNAPGIQRYYWAGHKKGAATIVPKTLSGMWPGFTSGADTPLPLKTASDQSRPKTGLQIVVEQMIRDKKDGEK